jgi:hypothetical protein
MSPTLFFRAVFVNILRSPGIDSQPGRIHSLASIPRLLKHYKYGLWCFQKQMLYYDVYVGVPVLFVAPRFK